MGMIGNRALKRTPSIRDKKEERKERRKGKKQMFPSEWQGKRMGWSW
jgi:hypothetical protein